MELEKRVGKQVRIIQVVDCPMLEGLVKLNPGQNYEQLKNKRGGCTKCEYRGGMNLATTKITCYYQKK